MKLTLNQLQKINSKNLLRYFKAERKRLFAKGYKYTVLDEDELGNPIKNWINTSNKDTFNDDINYFYFIKTELDTRNNISKEK